MTNIEEKLATLKSLLKNLKEPIEGLQEFHFAIKDELKRNFTDRYSAQTITEISHDTLRLGELYNEIMYDVLLLAEANGLNIAPKEEGGEA